MYADTANAIPLGDSIFEAFRISSNKFPQKETPNVPHMAKKPRMYNGENTVSSINGVGENRQLHAK